MLRRGGRPTGRWLPAAAALLVAASGACRREPFAGPLALLRQATASGAAPRVGPVTVGGETRPSLLEPAAFQVPLPRRPLLTFGLGSAASGTEEPPGWFRVAVKAGGRTVAERNLNPRALKDWRDLSVPLEGLGRQATLEFDFQLTDREGRPIARPSGLVLAVSDPVVHDLDAYGGARGIVLVSIDTLRRDHVGAYGYARPTTPRLDAVAARGLRLDDAVSTSSWTLPAHLSMLTSADPAAHGGTDMRHGYNRRVPTLPALLKDAGYATQAVTSHLYVSAVYGLDQGFDHLDFRQDRKATDVANRAIDLLDRLGDRPFFLFLHFYDPHWHYDPPDEARRLFETGYEGGMTGLWQDFSKRRPEDVAPADLAHLLALYDGEIRYTDGELGRVLDHLAARGLDRSTLVVVTSDHGEEFLDHGSWEHQKTLYEEVVRVPLVFAGPGIPARVEKTPASLLDVMPTVLGWAGRPVPLGAAGRNLLAPPAEREGYGETDHTVERTHKLFLRAGQSRWKAILTLDKTGGKVLGEEWYDLAADPAERRNAPPPPAIAESIRQRALARWRGGRSQEPARPVCLTAEQAERLRALGYVDGAAGGPCPADAAVPESPRPR